MPTKREREYYRMGFQDGVASTHEQRSLGPPDQLGIVYKDKPKRKLSAWNKYVKAKRNHIKYRTGPDKGKLNLRLMGVAFRRTPAGKKKR
jgi:hypothetical protein